MSQKVAVFGAGGHAKVVLDIILSTKKDQQVAIFDDLYSEQTSLKLLDFPIIGNTENLCQQKINFIVAIGNNQIRAAKQKYFIAHQLMPAQAMIHPGATVSRFAFIDVGTVVMAGSVINPGSHIGTGVIINTSASIDHDCKIEDFVHVAPNATLCGNVCVGEYSWIGAGAIVKEGIKIGKNCLVGAGAVVVDDVPNNTQVLGIPAKPTKKR